MEGFSKMGPRTKRVLLAALDFLNGLEKVCLGDLRCGSGISLCTNDARRRDHDDTSHRDAASRGKNSTIYSFTARSNDNDSSPGLGSTKTTPSRK